MQLGGVPAVTLRSRGTILPVFRALLQELLQVPGANYCCIADGTTGKVLDSAGVAPDDGSGVSLAVLGWGATAAGYLAAAAGDELDDLIVTSRRAYHLVRQFDGRSGQPMLIGGAPTWPARVARSWRRAVPSPMCPLSGR